MKTKGFLLCLLFLMLGTTTVLADKYYMPSSYKGGSNHATQVWPGWLDRE